MASIVNRPDGHRWIQFVDSDRSRKTLRLGKVTAKYAADFCRRVEELLSNKITGDSPDRDLSKWLAGIDASLRDKIAKVGLTAKRAHGGQLQSFINDYVANRTDAKPATKEVWRQGANGLVEFFGANYSMARITSGDADRYKLQLIGSGLAPYTVRKRLQFAKMIMRSAVRHKVIAENPFDDVSVKATMSDRQRFITPEETVRLLEWCPNQDWRLIVALARYGGLRCPSEVLSLRWQDIDWQRETIRVWSPKTEHHPGKESRTIPLFPELREVLADGRELAADKAVYVIDEKFRKSSQGPAGWRNTNLRTTFEKIVQRAGLVAWPRPFHNLRSSRQTELAEQFPSHVVCEWLGNSEDIARRHYLQVTDDHHAQAVAKAKQNPKQSVSESDRMSPHEPTTAKQLCPEFAGNSQNTASPQNAQADGEGFEPPYGFRHKRFSRPSPSTTRPPIQRTLILLQIDCRSNVASSEIRSS